MDGETSQAIYAMGECEIDLARREVRIGGSPVPIGGRAFEIVEVLAQAAGELVSKDGLMDRIWPGAVVLENTLQVHAAAIRKALGPHRRLLKTESGRGYRLLGDWTLRRRDTPRVPASTTQVERLADPPGSTLPLPAAPVVGRAGAVQQLRDLISAYRVVTLTGPGGIGKTSLALQVAHSVVADFPDGTWLVELASVADPGLVPPAVAQALGLKLPAEEEVSAASVARVLGDQHLLLVLDNCEHVIDSTAPLAETLVRLCPRVAILATSREILRIEGERAYRVLPLEGTGDRATGTGPNSRSQCGRAFYSQGRSPGRGLVVAKRNPPNNCDYLPPSRRHPVGHRICRSPCRRSRRRGGSTQPERPIHDADQWAPHRGSAASNTTGGTRLEL